MALIGDDDLVSIPLALMGHDVLVLDVDEYLIDLINQANKFFSINITAKNVNLLNEIGPELKGKYDVIYADPVSTNEGYSVFVKRGYELLKDNGFAFITVTDSETAIFSFVISDKSFAFCIVEYPAFEIFPFTPSKNAIFLPLPFLFCTL